MRKILCTLVLFIILLTLVGCSKPTPEDSRPYDIIQEGSEYFLLLRAPIPSQPNHTIDPRPEIIFSSFDELRADIQTANFTQRERSTLHQFGRASLERFEQKIPIFNHIYVPILPESAQIKEIIWHGRSYSVNINCDQAQTVSYYPFVTQAEYQETVDYYQNFETNAEIDITSTSFDSERSATVYDYTTAYGSHRRFVYYSAANKGTEYHIAESYDSPEATVPTEIDIYANKNGRYFFITLSGLTVRPSVEWLTSFGIAEEPHLQVTS